MSDCELCKLPVKNYAHSEIICGLRTLWDSEQLADDLVIERAFDAIAKLEAELSAMQQRAEAAEALITASQGQKPVGVVRMTSPPDGHAKPIPKWDMSALDMIVDVLKDGDKLHAAPVIPPDVAELQRKLSAEENAHAELQSRCYDQGGTFSNVFDECKELKRENAELTRKLAEQQALLSQLDTAMPNFAQMFNVLEQDWVRDNCWTTWDEETITEFRRLHKAVCNPDTEELTKLLEEAKRQVVPAEDVFQNSKRYIARRKSIYLARARLQVSGSFKSEQEFNDEYDSSCDKNIDGYVIDGRGVWTKDAAMLAVAPSPETDIDREQGFK